MWGVQHLLHAFVIKARRRALPVLLGLDTGLPAIQAAVTLAMAGAGLRLHAMHNLFAPPQGASWSNFCWFQYRLLRYQLLSLNPLCTALLV